jgi:BirA family biotin operon repressor/biotin-[acetyl-CoA-carboxylase] ligase
LTDTNTNFIGKVLHRFEELPSTNEYALELLSKSTPEEGTAISTQNQTAGRGQIGRKWESAPGENLTVSIILYPTFLAATQNFQLNKAFSLGARDFVASALPSSRVFVKWPNDIYVNDRKICGILIQNAIQRDRIQNSVLGVGLNVNQSHFTWAPNATSLFLESGQAFSLDQTLLDIFFFLEKRYRQLSLDAQALNEDYLSALYRIHQESEFQKSDGRRFKGTITGVGPAGHLLVLHEHQIGSYDLKEIQMIL